MKYFTVARTDTGTRIWMSLYNASAQELFQERFIQNFVEMLYCGMTRFGSIKLGVFRQYQNTKTIF